jgi:hypothetical protein
MRVPCDPLSASPTGGRHIMCGGTMGSSPELGLDLALMALFLCDFVIHGLRSTGFSPTAPEGGGVRRKGVCGGGSSSHNSDVIGRLV